MGHIRFRPPLGKVYQVKREQLFEDIILLFLGVATLVIHAEIYADTITVKIILIMVVVLVLIA